jgi:cell fate regulator YaaT (PSP1 superfamily)
MDRIVEVEIRRVDKPSYFRLPDSAEVKKGDVCIVEFTQGTQDYGRLLSVLDTRNFFKLTVVGKILRKTTPEDMAVIRDNVGRKFEAMKITAEKIRSHNLPMKLVDAEYSFDRTRITFYYWAEGRIDFRRLVKDLAGIFTCRIEMRQIGLRDEAKIKGGCGICGRSLCCATFLRNFESITMRMVKNQKLPLDMNKITGLCGRLLCCLSYEEAFYKEKEPRK